MVDLLLKLKLVSTPAEGAAVIPAFCK